MHLPIPSARRSILIAFCATGLSAQAQDPCDELDILDITYPTFTTATSLQVTVQQQQPSEFFFSYPQFMLISTEGDTVALEPMVFFGIGPGEQVHHMDLQEGMAPPPTPFTGSLVLQYFGMKGNNTCTWPLQAVDLCPAPPCDTIQVSVQTNGGQPVDAGFTWYITDAGGGQAAEGTFELGVSGDLVDIDPVCLPPGSYVLHMARSFGAGGEFSFGVSRQDFFTVGPSTAFIHQSDPSIPTDLPFVLYPLCTGIGNGIVDQDVLAPLIQVSLGSLLVRSADGGTLGSLEVTDVAGRPVQRMDARASSVVVPLSGRAPGVYILRSTAGVPSFPAQRFILP